MIGGGGVDITSPRESHKGYKIKGRGGLAKRVVFEKTGFYAG